jgi:hypothetical protein
MSAKLDSHRPAEVAARQVLPSASLSFVPVLGLDRLSLIAFFCRSGKELNLKLLEFHPA